MKKLLQNGAFWVYNEKNNFNAPRARRGEALGIAKKPSFLSRLLGKDGQAEARAAEEQRIQEETAAEKEAEERPPRPSPEIYLPPTHVLNLLWSMYAQTFEEEKPPAPHLSFEAALAPPDGPDPSVAEQPLLLNAEEIGKEQERFLSFLTAAANQRQVKIRKASTEDAAPDIDAEILVFLTSRRMCAWVLALPPTGEGMGLDKKMLEDAMKKAAVTHGVDSELLQRIPGLPERYFSLFLAARGDLPVHGKDGYVVDRFSRDQIKTLSEDESGNVDFMALELFQTANKGDVICDIFYPTDAVNGMTVLGQPVPGRAGKQPQIPRGRNTDLSEDKAHLIATREGHVEFSGRSFQVKPVLDIRGDVDYGTGNLNCLGDIHIYGDVRSGFAIRATGNITVDGVIESATVEAGGDLIVRSGVQGNGTAVLRAHRNIFARFIESSSVYVGENVEAEHLVNCSVYSDKDVTVRSGRGTIIGGQIHAAQTVSANIVGARSELRTSIFLGGKPYEQFERESIASTLRQLEKTLESLDKQPESPAKQQQMSKTRLQISANKMKLSQYDKTLEKEMEAQRQAGGEESAPRGRLECNVLYPGTEITMGAYHMKVTNETRMCQTSIQNGDLTLIAT